MSRALYSIYLKSDEWKLIANKCKLLAGNKCSLCHSTKSLQAHHLNYNNIGEEKQEDLVCLCSICHSKKHGINTLAANNQKPRYYRFGNGIRNTFMQKSYTPIDAIDALTDLTTQEQWTIRFLKNNLILIDERVNGAIKLRTSSKSIISTSELSSADKQKFQTGYKRLHAKNLLKRVKRQHYIFNPNFFIPHFYDEEMKLFDSLV